MDRISLLLYKRITSTLTPDEELELKSWAEQSQANRNVDSRLSDMDFLAREQRLRSLVDSQKAAADMKNRISRLGESRRRWIAAASVAIVVCGAAIFMNRQPDAAPTSLEMAQVDNAPKPLSIEDIKPGQTKAILRDNSGNFIALNSLDADKTNSNLFNSASTRKKIEELKLDVPRGNEFHFFLEDSTEVWLNAESSLRYPEVFGDKERRVSVSGEVCFKVRPDKKRPFYVEADGQQIRVYGTTFNVRNYSDDQSVATTLEEGSIALSKLGEPGGELHLSPGHQAVFDKLEKKVSMKVVNPSVITGWRHGKFVFEEQPLSQIMRDLSRWYNFDYEFADFAVSQLVFKGSIPRYADFKTAITILETSGGIEFSVVDNKILVASKNI